MPGKISCVIEIGSNLIHCKIVQRRGNILQVLENIEHDLMLGKDTFSSGKISFDKLDEVYRIINKFIILARGYGINEKDIKTIATTAVREAKNKDYIIDQIKVKTGLEVNIMDDSEEKFHNYKNLIKVLDQKSFSETSLIAYISSGSLGIAVYKKGKIVYNQNILIGTLKLSEILGKVKHDTDKLYIMIEDYLSTYTNMLSKTLPVKEIKNFVVLGREVNLLLHECETKQEHDFFIMEKEELNKFYNNVKDKLPEQLSYIYNLKEDKAEILLPCLGIYKSLFELTSAEEILLSKEELADSVIYSDLFDSSALDLEKTLKKSTVETAKNLAKRFQYDEKHAKYVEDLSLKIFDKLKDIHGLGKKEKLILQTAAILHDIGKYINIRNHYIHSYNIIKGSDIIGLNKYEIEVVANLARYHSRILPSLEHEEYRNLKSKNRVLLSKLLAILRLADGLDRSHKQKAQDIVLKLEDNELYIYYRTTEDMLIDEWSFNSKSKFLQEVFGIKAYLIKRRG